MNHAYMPIGPVGKPTELHLAFPILTFQFTKAPQACKALIAFMLEAENFNPWVEAAQGYLSHFLIAYDNNPVWTADPKRTPYRDVVQAHADARRPGLARREGGGGDRRLHRGRHVRELSQPAARTPRARSRWPSGRRSASIAERHCSRRPAQNRPPDSPSSPRWSETTAWSTPRSRTRAAAAARSLRPGAGSSRTGTGSATGSCCRRWRSWSCSSPIRSGSASGCRSPTPDRPRRRVHRPRELRVAAGTTRSSGLSVFNTLLYTIVASVIKFARRALSRAAAQQAPAVQGDDPRRGPDPVHRADRALGDRVLVDLRHPVLDHLLVAAASSA